MQISGQTDRLTDCVTAKCSSVGILNLKQYHMLHFLVGLLIIHSLTFQYNKCTCNKVGFVPNFWHFTCCSKACKMNWKEIWSIKQLFWTICGMLVTFSHYFDHILNIGLDTIYNTIYNCKNMKIFNIILFDGKFMIL